jgi:hypothetical protein
MLKALAIKISVALVLLAALWIAVSQWERATLAEDKWNDTVLRLQHTVARTDTVRAKALVSYRTITAPLRTDTVHDSVSIQVVRAVIASADSVVAKDSVAFLARDSLIYVLRHPPSPPRLVPSAAFLIDSRLLATVQLQADYRLVGKFYITGQLNISQVPNGALGIRVRF